MWGLPQPLGQGAAATNGLGGLGGGAWGAPGLPSVVPAAGGLPPPPVRPGGGAAPGPVAAASPTGPVGSPPAAAGGREQYVVKCKGLPFSATAETVCSFFDSLKISEGGVHMRLNDNGLPSGECFVEFSDGEAVSAALEKNRRAPPPPMRRLPEASNGHPCNPDQSTVSVFVHAYTRGGGGSLNTMLLQT